jgi:hypothetical protein
VVVTLDQPSGIIVVDERIGSCAAHV